MSPALQILMVILNAAASIIGSLVLYNLKQQEKRIDKLEFDYKALVSRKTDCKDEFVSSGAWVREAGYTRQRLDDAISLIATLTAKVDLRSEIPLIASQVAASTVAEMMKRMENRK